MMYLALEMAGFIAAAAVVGACAGLAWRGVGARRAEQALTRELREVKSRIPKLETGVRGRDQHVQRLNLELDEWRARAAAADTATRDRERALRDKEREIAKARADLALARRQDPERMASGAEADAAAERDKALEARLASVGAELESARRELSDAEATRMGAVDALGERDQRIRELEAQRQRQDKWLEIAHQQLDHARGTARTRSSDRDADERVRALEGEIERMKAKVADSDRRYAESRFQLADARTSLAVLKAGIAGRDSPANATTGASTEPPAPPSPANGASEIAALVATLGIDGSRQEQA